MVAQHSLSHWPGRKTRQTFRKSQHFFFLFATDKLTLTLQIAFSGFHWRHKGVPVVVFWERCEFRNNVLRRRYKAKIDARAANNTLKDVCYRFTAIPAQHKLPMLHAINHALLKTHRMLDIVKLKHHINITYNISIPT